ncbi:MAG: hypothetical protein GWP18_02055, partial [Proteobacteria bacterium]|nr:hypothetical protein [Pseudomonadota bacterium]
DVRQHLFHGAHDPGKIAGTIELRVHPDIDIRWNKVTIVLSTHSEGALTSKDLALATEFDAFTD